MACSRPQLWASTWRIMATSAPAAGSPVASACPGPLAYRSRSRSLPSRNRPVSGSRIRRLVPLDPPQPSLGGPGLDHELVGLGVQSGDDDLGDVGDEHLPVGLVLPLVRGHTAGGDGSPRDLGLARPVALLAGLRVERGPMKGESGIPDEVCPLACARHRPETKIAVLELALDPRDARRAVAAQRGDGLMPA